jgi:decaprenyl-phosphate phosphoribosyltransferase
MSAKDYIAIARPDNWFKNIFVLPGVVVAALFTSTPMIQYVWSLIIGLAGTCLVASANYVINEWLDAEFDRFHPIKKSRPSVSGNMKASWIYLEYVLLSAAGLGLGSLVSMHFLLVLAVLLIMGILYNVKPFRTKERAYLDVLSESINNPIRLLLGWFIVTNQSFPPSSLLFGYWMGGAFLMAVKRYAELRSFGDRKLAALYRSSFRYYTEENLLVSSFYYGICSAFFVGVFLVKYRLELLFSLPFISLLFSWYLYIGLKPNSAAQYPERLYHEKHLIVYIILLFILVSALLFFDIPWLGWFLKKSFISK